MGFQIKLFCDGCYGKAEYHAPPDTELNAAIHEARRYGWHYFAGKVYCPECKGLPNTLISHLDYLLDIQKLSDADVRLFSIGETIKKESIPVDKLLAVIQLLVPCNDEGKI